MAFLRILPTSSPSSAKRDVARGRRNSGGTNVRSLVDGGKNGIRSFGLTVVVWSTVRLVKVEIHSELRLGIELGREGRSEEGET